jgi:mannose-6-phosphate isomerase
MLLSSDLPALRAASDLALRWLRDACWPLWLDNGIDRGRGGFHEHLTLDGFTCGADFRRLRVVTRQIYVFSEAASAGYSPAEEAVELGVDFLRRRARRDDGGYAWRFRLDGEVANDTRDLYDHAFVLLALSSAARVLPAAALREEALTLDTYLQTHFPHSAGGYLESLPPALPRRQNPHMHLLEAYLAAADSFGEDRFLDRADRLVSLFLERLFQTAEGALPEFFDDQLTAQRQEGCFIVEPGHHAEWIWLLDWHASLTRKAGRPLIQAATASRQLGYFMDAYGVSPVTGALIDEVWSDGSPRATTSRLWPQTERLKAEILREDADTDRILKAYSVLRSYFIDRPSGLWHEHMTPDGSFVAGPAPASSLYHLTAAILTAHRAIETLAVVPAGR